MDRLPVGRRVAYWRARRGMSQQALADALGKSKSWVDKVERSVRRLDKLSNLQEIARALRIDVQLLLGTEPSPTDPDDATDTRVSDRDVDAVRVALFRYDATLPRPDHTGPMSRRDLRRAVEHGWLAFQHTDYRQLLRGLPGLLRDTQRLRLAHPDDPTAYHLLGQAHQLTSALLGKLGETGMAWLTADRALTNCQHADDAVLTASAAGQLARVLHAMGRPRHSLEVAIAVAHRLAPADPLTAAPAPHLPGCGSLLLHAALGAAGCGDRPGVRDLLDQADEVAAIVGESPGRYGTSCAPVLVELTRVTAALDLGDHTDALNRHRALLGTPAFQRLPVEQRAAHLVDVAGRCVRLGDLAEAGRALLLAYRTAPAEVRHRPAARNTLRTLVRRATRPAPEITHLAESLRVAV
ncbi:helix-turn-helix domain-containing protein [Micromonospora cathayae]|uniref:Helix-turn-helix domain-containing protein n=1 Tax=Micromonospora cathayae TaxID=3028804 RepID=A0ABY7ZNH8_9ACTN|nr:helix-turn-helix domain-containing protein [Micromonospora sp. HUAS 3]WDZ84575.1 helix-turn-helix domain-containing protein [Micromonospora sp. HUAS 3]